MDAMENVGEIDRLLESLFDTYGYDFRDYSRAHVQRRIQQRLRVSGYENVAVLRDKVLSDREFAASLMQDLSINVTEMFRDPDFYLALREKVLPVLRTWPYIKIWHAGCSTGEEVYSMAILLQEEGLYDRVQIYATDFNNVALNRAREGIFSAESIKKYAQNYHQSGARASFSDYYLARYDSAIMDNSLKKNVVWADHNLVTDAVFAETHLIVCRNVLIYFNSKLQNRVHDKFYHSLVKGGFLCLGKKETIQSSGLNSMFSETDRRRKIYRKKYTQDDHGQSI
jgi:chemotaxis protein methyltransferase CheR